MKRGKNKCPAPGLTWFKRVLSMLPAYERVRKKKNNVPHSALYVLKQVLKMHRLWEHGKHQCSAPGLICVKTGSEHVPPMKAWGTSMSRTWPYTFKTGSETVPPIKRGKMHRIGPYMC